MGAQEDRIRWNHRFSRAGFAPDWAPDVGLVSRVRDFPVGRAIDLACGVGANALFLAKRGFEVDAVDLSDVAIERLRRAACAEGVMRSVHLHLADLSSWTVPEAQYQVAVCTRFLDRALCPKISAALSPGGVLFYRTYTVKHLDSNPEFPSRYLLEVNELRTLFPDLLEMQYEENENPSGATALLLAQKPT